MPGGKAITERGSSCCSCRTFQSPKKRADARGKPDPSLMSLSLSHSPPKPRPSPQLSPSCPLTIHRYKCGSATFHLCAPQVFSHLPVKAMAHPVIPQLLRLTWPTAPAVQTLRKCWAAMGLMVTWCDMLAAIQSLSGWQVQITLKQ